MSEDFNRKKDYELQCSDDMETNEEETDKSNPPCPRCGSIDTEDWRDGNFFCNNCDKQFMI